MGLRRNLTAGEIVTQVLTLKKELGDYAGKLNLVFMGMGEPLLNYDNLARALRIICEPDGLNISPRHVTVSTAGILENLEKLERDFPLVKIAFSLNAPDAPPARRADAGLAPARTWTACWPSSASTSAASASPSSTCCCRGQRLRRPRPGSWRKLLHGIPAKVNLIPYNENPRPCLSGAPTRPRWKNSAPCCWRRGLTVITRWSKGAGHPLGLRPAGRS